MNHLKKTTIQGAREKFNMSLYISTKGYTPVNIRIIEISNTENCGFVVDG